MNNKITDVFFDLDHTLWDFDKNSALTFDLILKKNKIDVSLSSFLEHYMPINLKYWKLYRDEKVSKNDLRFERLNETFNAINIKLGKQLVNKLSEDYIEYLTTHNHIFDGTLEILDYLKPKYKLHIITNGFEEVQNRKLSHANIIHYFDTITNSEMVGVKKPNPKMFHFALDQAKTKKESSIMIGDNYEADILGALNIGLDAICFNYHKVALDKNIKQVNNLIDLKSFL